jgi:hypothetical protein
MLETFGPRRLDVLDLKSKVVWRSVARGEIKPDRTRRRGAAGSPS